MKRPFNPESGYFKQGLAVGVLFLPFSREWRYLSEVSQHAKGDTTYYGIGGMYETMEPNFEWIQQQASPWSQKRTPANQVIIYPLPAPTTPFAKIIGVSVLGLD